MTRTRKPRTSWAVSASQVEAFNLCERKWAFRTEEKYAQNIGAFRGESVWLLVQRYGKDGTPPENSRANLVKALATRYTADLDEKGTSPDEYAGRIIALANKLIELYPQPPWPRKHKVEDKFRVKIDGVPWTGAIDMHGPGYVRDNKVTSSPDFALLLKRDPSKPKHESRELLRENVQALIYAWRKMQREGLVSVKLDWVYGQPGARPRVWRVLDEVSKEYVDERILEINETGRKIVRLALAHPDPLSLKPNWDGCHQYGGCPFQDKCQPTIEDIASTVFPIEEQEEKTMGMLSDLKGKKSAAEKPPVEEDEEIESEEENEEEEEVEAPKGKPARGERGAGKVDRVTMTEKAREDVEQFVGMKVKSDQIIESIINKYKFLTEDEIEVLIAEFAPKKPTAKKAPKVEVQDEEEAPAPPPKKTLGAKVTPMSSDLVAVRAMVAKALRDAADALDD